VLFGCICSFLVKMGETGDIAGIESVEHYRVSAPCREDMVFF